MKEFVERIVRLHYSPDDMKFKDQQHHDEFLKALGHMVWYGMQSDRPRSIELVNIGIDRDLEITAAYFNGWKFKGEESLEVHRPYYQVEEALKWLRIDRPFVMGAVPREKRYPDDPEFHYSFHS